jgi:phosphinothricin acetyltransferase
MPSAQPALPSFAIEPMTREDWPAVRAIYEAGIATGHATFEVAAPSWEEWNRTHSERLRLVARAIPGGAAIGWAAITPVSDRCVYAGVGESSVYIAPEARGRGVGRALMTALLAASESAGLWTVQTGIFPENTASLSLHRAVGFRDVGVRRKIGRMNGRWRDVVFLERRSPTVGTG